MEAAMQRVLLILQKRAWRAKFLRLDTSLGLKKKASPPFCFLFHAVIHDIFSGLVLSGKVLLMQPTAGRKGSLFLGCYQSGCCNSSAAMSCGSHRPVPSFLWETDARILPCLAHHGVALHRCQMGCEMSLCCAGNVTGLI